MADYGDLDDHATAFMAYLYANNDLTVYPQVDGGATTVPAGTPPPYVVVQIVSDAIPDGGRMTHKSTRFRMRAYCQCVGANDVAARIVAGIVSRAVLDQRPEIEGRACFPIRQEISREPLSSDTTGATTVTITSVYRLESEPGVGGS